MASSLSSSASKIECVFRSKIEEEVFDICFDKVIEAEDDTDFGETKSYIDQEQQALFNMKHSDMVRYINLPLMKCYLTCRDTTYYVEKIAMFFILGILSSNNYLYV